MNGIIALAGDVPPDVISSRVTLPPVLIGRGESDEWYGAEKLEADLRFLRGATRVTTSLFQGGHEWTDPFRIAAGDFLNEIGG